MLRDQIRNVAEALHHVEAAIDCLESGAPVRGELNEIAAVIRRDLHSMELQAADEENDEPL
jgi:hypothetical protein